MKSCGQRKYRALDAHLALLHRLEKRRLRLRSGAIDLIDQHDVGEQRPGAKHETALALVEHVHADDVARHEVRGPLDAFELPAESVRERLGEQRLAQARHPLHEHVAARDERDDEGADRRLRADDDATELTGQFRLKLRMCSSCDLPARCAG